MAKDVVYTAKLDTSDIIKGLRAISDSVDQLQKAFGKALVVKIDTSQFSALQLTITRSFDRLGNKLVNDFDANTNKIIATLNKLGPAAASVGQQIGDQLGKGMTAGVTAGAKQSENVLKEMSDRQQDRLQKVFNSLHAQYDRLGALGGPGAQALANDKMAALGVGLPQSLNDLTINGAGKYESKTYIDSVRRSIQDATTDLRKLQSLELEVQKQFSNRNIPKPALQGPVLADGQFTRGFGFSPPGAADQKALQAEVNASHAAALKMLADEEKAQQRVTAATKGTQTSQEGVGSSLLQSISLTLRWLLVFRVIRDATQAIEQSIGALISSGADFIKAQETQTLGLQGILAENFTLLDAQGKQLDGTAKLTSLQGLAKQQWTEIAAAALHTGGSTEDLVHLYEKLLPLASRFGKTMTDAQTMTSNASLAGKFLGMSDDSLASSINGLLMGRAPARNPLVSALGISVQDIARLKGTPALFDLIQDKLKKLVETAGPEFQTTFAAMSDKLKDFLGKIGSAIDQPFVDKFKQFVGLLESKLFTGGTGQFSPALLAFLTTLRTAAADAMQPLENFGRSLEKTAGTDAPAFAVGVGTVAKSVVQLGIYIAQAVIAVTELISHHAQLFTFFSTMGPLILLVAAAFDKLSKGLLSGAMGSAFDALATKMFGATTRLVQGSTTATESMTKLGLSLRSLGTTTVVAAAVAGIIGIIDYIVRLRTEANAAKAAVDAIGKGNFDEASLHATTLLNSPASDQVAKGAALLTSSDQKRLDDLGKLGIFDANDAHAATSQLQGMLDKALSSKNASQAKEIRDQLDAINALLQPSGNIGKFDGAIAQTQAKLGNLGTKARDALSGGAASKAITDAVAAIKASKDADAAIEAKIATIAIGTQFSGTVKSNPIPGPAPKEAPFSTQAIGFAEKVDLSGLGKAQKDLDALHQLALISDEDYATKSADIATGRAAIAQKYLTEEENAWFDFVAKKKAAGADGNKLDEETTAKLAEFASRQLDITTQSDDALRGANTAAASNDQKIAAEKKALEEKANVDLVRIYGERGDAQQEELKRQLEQEKAALHKRGLSAADIDKDPSITKIQKAIDLRGDLAVAENSLKNIQVQRQIVTEQQAAADDKYQRGEVTLGTTLKTTADLHKRQIDLNNQEIDELQREQAIREHAAALSGVRVDPSVTEASAAAVKKLQDANAKLGQTLVSNAQAVDAFNQAMSATAQFAGVFDTFNTGLGTFVGLLSKATSGASQLGGMIKSWMDVSSKVKMAGGGVGGFLTGFSPLASKNEDGSTSTLAAVTGGAILGASTIISVASALFQRAVKKAEDTMTKSIKGVSDSLAAGSITVGQSLTQLEQARAAAVAKFSNSKSGRAALKDMLPQFDQQIQQTINQLNSNIKSFKDKLKDSLLGTGPFADFARQLLQLSNDASQYLDSVAGLYGKASTEYKAALEDVHKLYEETLKEAKAAYEAQNLDNNSQALSDAQNVLDLTQQQSDLYGQMADLADQKQELDKEAAQDATDQAKAQTQLDKQRLDNSKKILDLEKQIADVVRKAADDEKAVRQRGILEAQQTIAEQKAMEISQIRDDAANQIADLQNQLTDAQSQVGDLNQQQTDLNNQYADKLAALNKQEIALDKQVKTTQHQIDLNNVRLDVAKRIAGIEGTIFDITGDDLELERKRGAIQIQQAQDKVTQWQQVQALIDSITTSGDGIIFNAPPGFPQIKVTIGDIIIDNSSTTNGTPSPKGPPPNGPGGPGREPPTPPRGKIPGDRLPADFSDIERKFLS